MSTGIVFSQKDNLWICVEDGWSPLLIRPVNAPMELRCPECKRAWVLTPIPKEEADG